MTGITLAEIVAYHKQKNIKPRLSIILPHSIDDLNRILTGSLFIPDFICVRSDSKMLDLYLSAVLQEATEICFTTHVNEEIFLSLLRKLRISRDPDLTPKKVVLQ